MLEIFIRYFPSEGAESWNNPCSSEIEPPTNVLSLRNNCTAACINPSLVSASFRTPFTTIFCAKDVTTQNNKTKNTPIFFHHMLSYLYNKEKTNIKKKDMKTYQFK